MYGLTSVFLLVTNYVSEVFWLIKTATFDDSVILNSEVYLHGIILKAHYIKN